MPQPIPHIVVVGSINMDLVARVARLPRAGETVSGRTLESIPGGKGANQAVAAARLGAKVTMCGRLGDDAFAPQLRASLVDAGVNAETVHSTPGCSSGVAWIGVDDSGANSITVIAGANGRVTIDDVREWEPKIQSADMVIVQGEIPVPAIAAVLDAARRHGVRSIFDVAPVPTEPMPSECWQADILSPNQTEAEQLTGLPVDSWMTAEGAAVALHQLEAKTVVLKLGILGALIHEPGQPAVRVPAFQVDAVDTTAAGDAFTAALAVAWAGGSSLAEATRFACAAGACAAMTLGAQPAMPTRAAIEAVLSSTK
ncbi:MAG TPA: ribokinase [Planctomycetaceae bacterium]|nr:ribokinase [Planctomycetaceae bacterium]